MFQPTKPELCPSAGFTLIEALAALAVMATSMAAIGALANSSIRSGLYVERHVAQIETARKIITGMPPRAGLANGPLTGTLDNHQWRIESTAFPNNLTRPGSDIQWTPRRIALRVLAPGGALVEIDTIRLTRAGAR